MDPLVRASLLVRRSMRQGAAFAVACALSAYLVVGASSSGRLGAAARGGMRGVLAAPVPSLLALSIWGLFVARRISQKVRLTGEASARLDAELGVLLVIGVEGALLRFGDGGVDGRYGAALYLVIALVSAFARPVSAMVALGWALSLEAAFHQGPGADGGAFVVRAAAVTAFALLNLGLVRAEVARTREAARVKLDEELVRLKDDARRYRLLGSGEAHGERAEDQLARSSVEEIHQSVHYALELLRRTLDLHTAVLLWLNDAGSHLRISELSTASDDIHDAPFAAGDGVLGAVLARKERVSLVNLRPSYKIPYYVGPCPIRVLTALPVIDEQTLCGVLALDRVDNRPFTEQEEELAAHAARHCLRAIQNERVFLHLERAKVEQGKLYRAAQALAAAASEREVLEVGVRAASEIASFDLAAVTIFDPKSKMHEVCAVKSSDDALMALTGARFAHNAGLVSMVVENRFALPYRGESDASHQLILSKRFPFPKFPSLLVLPLVLRERALGTLILGARRRHAFGDAVRPTLEVLASHLAVSLSNARLIQALETMATTDPMTGLLNKRAILDAATQKIASANRFGRELAVLVTDIDFFKKVNDTYGHDIGDLVIRGLGDILKRQKRSTDVVARFGGEEFVVLCEQTDEDGALLLAERIREELEKTAFHTPNGKLSVTCSIGIATLPSAGRDWTTLFKAADEALYESKRSGRNRTTISQEHVSGGRIHQFVRPKAPARG